MISKLSRAGGIRVAGVLAVLLIMTSLTLPTGAWADTSNTQTVNSNAVQLPGTSTMSGGGIAVSGPAIAMNVPIVVQQNFQMDMSGNPNNVQHASNNATVTQSTGAASGNTSGTNGGMAMSGGSVASSLGVVLQLNIQLILGDTPPAGITQSAGNDATLGQTTLSASGNSSANGGGSTAVSGGAVASNTAVISQMNTQLYIGSFGVGSPSPVTQNVANAGTISQNLTSASGGTSATGSSHASSGGASANMSQMLTQFQTQVAH